MVRHSLLTAFCFIHFIAHTAYTDGHQGTEANYYDSLLSCGEYRQVESLICTMLEKNSNDASDSTFYLSELLKVYAETREIKKAENVIRLLERLTLNSEFRNSLDLSIILSNISVQLSKHDVGKARELINSILTKGDTILDSLNMARVLNYLGTCFFYEYEYDSALYFYLKAAAVINTIDPQHIEKGKYYQNIAIIHSIKGKYSAAEKYFKESVQIKKKHLKNYSTTIIKAYINFGYFLFELSKIDHAYKYFDSAEMFLNKSFKEDNIYLGYIYWHKGNCFAIKGDFYQAKIYFDKAYLIFKEKLGKDNSELTKIKLNQGFIYEKIRQYDKAYEYYQYCLIDSLSPSIIKTHRNLANLHAIRHEDKKAMEHYNKSIAAAKKMFGPTNHDLGLSYMYLGKFLSERNDPACLEYLDGANDIFYLIFGERNRDIAMTWNFKGNYLSDNGHPRQAIDAYRQSILASGMGRAPHDRESAGPTEISSDIASLAYGNMARIYLKQYLGSDRRVSNLTTCLALFDTAITINRGIREAYQTDDSKLIAIEDFHAYHQLAVYTSCELYERTGDPAYLEKGFEFSEKARASQLYQAIREADAKIDAGIPPSILGRERDIKNDMASYSHLLHKEIRKIHPDSSKIDLWRHEFFKLKKSYDSIIVFYENEYPDYYFLKYDTSVVSAARMASSLRSNEALLEYMVLDSLVVGFCITNDTLCAFRNRDNGALVEYYTTLRKSNQLAGLIFYDSAEHQQYHDALAGLYQVLLKPFGFLPEMTKLVIVQDQFLCYIPFETLVRSRRTLKGLSFTDPDYLLHHHAISYTPSASIFHRYNIREARRNHPIRLLAVAAGTGHETTSGDEGSPGTARRKKLPGALREAREISLLFQSRQLTGDKATETDFKSLAPAFRMLHFAMHTQVNDEAPMYSRLIFNPGGDTMNDGNLNTYEIYNMDIQGEQVVMSSCKSGAGKVRTGEGMMNLVRAFQYVGFPSVVATLWNVEDGSSCGLMRLYYTRLRQGLEKSEALRLAKIDFLEENSGIKAHPYFWAGFVHFGSSVPLPGNRSTTSLLMLIFVISITTLFFLVERYSKAK